MRRTRLRWSVGAGLLVAAVAVATATVVTVAVSADAVATAQDGEAPAEAGGTDPVADSLVGRWIEAAGGMEAYHGLRSARFTLTTELYDTISGRLRRTRPRYVTIAKTPDGERARIERWEGDDFIVHGFDGTEVWARMNGQPLGPGDKDYDEARYVAGDVNYWIALPFKLRDPGVFLHDRGRDDEGRHLVEVTFGTDVGEHQDVWRYFFEDGWSWPVEVQYIEEGKETVNRTRWEGLHTVDGYPYAERRVHFNDRGEVYKVIRTHDVEINADVDPAVFRAPASSPG